MIENVNELAEALHRRYGRPPTIYEIQQYLEGDDDRRSHIWKFGLPDEERELMKNEDLPKNVQT